MIYLLIRCKFCRELSTGQTQNIINYIFNCRRCNKAYKLWNKRERIYNSRVLEVSNNPREIAEKCRIAQLKEGEIENET